MVHLEKLLKFIKHREAVHLLLAFIDSFMCAHTTSYGIPDLVEIIRQIDKQLTPLDEDREKRVELSFIGHSMGAYVVTSVVRILSHVFNMREGLNSPWPPGDPPNQEELSTIGHAFRLKRLVLVSPDIQAEALISNRANFFLPAQYSVSSISF